MCNTKAYFGDFNICPTQSVAYCPLHVPLIGSKTVLQTQADWILRTSLFYARNGIDKVFYFQVYDDTLGGTSLYSTAGLADESTTTPKTWTRRPAADFLYQTNKLFGQYVYKETLLQDPIVDWY